MIPLRTPAAHPDFSFVTGSILAFLAGFLTTFGGITSLAAVTIAMLVLLPWLMKSELGVVTAWSAILGGMPQPLTESIGLAIVAVPMLIVLWFVNRHATGAPLIGRLSRLDVMMIMFTGLYIVSTLITAPSEVARQFCGNCITMFGTYWILRSIRLSRGRIERIMLAFFFGAAGSAAAVILHGNYEISEGVQRLAPGEGGANTYAGFVVAAFGVGIALLQTARGLYRQLIIAGLALLSLELLFSASRSALMGLVAILIVSFVFSRGKRYGRRRRPAFVAALIGIGIAVAISGGATLELIQGRVDTLLNHSQNATNDRVYLWPMALQGVKEHPIFGLGVGRFASPDVFHELGAEMSAPAALLANEPHNMFLGIATDIGLVGVTLMLLLLAFGFANMMKSSTKRVPFRSGILATLVGVIIANQFQPSQLEPALYFLLGLSELARLMGQRALLESKAAVQSRQRLQLDLRAGQRYRPEWNATR